VLNDALTASVTLLVVVDQVGIAPVFPYRASIRLWARQLFTESEATSRRLDAALAEIETGKGRLYDPAAVEACIGLFRNKGFAFQ
jgi:hypothetical protein